MARQARTSVVRRSDELHELAARAMHSQVHRSRQLHGPLGVRGRRQLGGVGEHGNVAGDGDASDPVEIVHDVADARVDQVAEPRRLRSCNHPHSLSDMRQPEESDNRQTLRSLLKVSSEARRERLCGSS